MSPSSQSRGSRVERADFSLSICSPFLLWFCALVWMFGLAGSTDSRLKPQAHGWHRLRCPLHSTQKGGRCNLSCLQLASPSLPVTPTSQQLRCELGRQLLGHRWLFFRFLGLALDSSRLRKLVGKKAGEGGLLEGYSRRLMENSNYKINIFWHRTFLKCMQLFLFCFVLNFPIDVLSGDPVSAHQSGIRGTSGSHLSAAPPLCRAYTYCEGQ